MRAATAQPMRWSSAGLACLACALAAKLFAHAFTITPVTLVITGDGAFQAEIGLDADALALGLPLEADSQEVAKGMREIGEGRFAAAVRRAREAVRQDIRIAVDAAPVAFAVQFPHYGTPAAVAADPPAVLGGVARLTGEIPAGARHLTLRASARYKTVSLEIVSPKLETPLRVLLEPGQASPPFDLAATGPPIPRQGVFGSYLKLGFTHIVPEGLDHVLFVLGLVLLSARWRPLLWQVTAFTAAHSVTLALSAQGAVSLPERLVETLIALSIAWVAIENMDTSELKPRRIAVVFCFGLLHGLGFAGVLSEQGLPAGRFLAALLSFNLGVELGQLAVVLMASAALARFRHLAGYRRYAVLPCSGAIAVTGLWWAVARAFA